MSSKTWYGCRYLRPDFQIHESDTHLTATWTTEGVPHEHTVAKATYDRRQLVVVCHDAITSGSKAFRSPKRGGK